MSGGLEEAARYEEQCMKKSLETGKATGRLEELKPEAPGGYAPLINVKSELRRPIPEQVIDTALRETGLDKFFESNNKKESALDTQVGGHHYKYLKIQPMTYSMLNGLNACQHTAIKYLTRYKSKGGIEDLKKAIHSIELLIEFEEKGMK